jgi:iron complex transport system substrate-binding protein
MRISRTRNRTTTVVIGILAASLAFAGCSGGTTPQSSPSQATVDDGFPVSIDTAYGEITVPEKPDRILVLSTTYLELLPYLDEAPLASPDDDESIAQWSPWLVGTDRGEVDGELIDSDYLISPEAVAAWDPDLILTDIWNADEALYAQLSQIAPTYVGIDTDTNTSWQNHLAALAELTGHDPAVVDEVEAEFSAELAAGAATVPGLAGASFQVAALGGDEQLWLTEYANAPLLALGLTPGEGQPTNGEEGASAPTYSQENVDQLTADVLFIATEHRDPQGAWRTALEADPRVAELPSSENGTLVYLTGPQWSAVNGGTPVSVLWWLDQILPVLEDSALNQDGQ